MTNKEFLKNMGIELTGDVEVDNKNLNKLFDVESEESIVVGYKSGVIPMIANISRNNYSFAYQNDIWKELSVGQKLRILKWQETDYMRGRGFTGQIPKFIFVTYDDYSEFNYSAMARDNSIEYNLDILSRTAGYNSLATTIHESIHELDFKTYPELINKYVPKYLRYADVANGYISENVMKLPLEGKVLNRLTGEYEYVTEQMREDFLLIKNISIRINAYKNTPNSKRQVFNFNSYEKYMRAMFYLVSPIEERAYEGSIEYVNWAYYKNKEKGYVASEEDLKALGANNKRLKMLSGKKREVQKAYKIPVWKAVNMELIHEFNNLIFGDKKVMYVCKKLMMEREMLRINFYYTKFKSSERTY